MRDPAWEPDEVNPNLMTTCCGGRIMPAPGGPECECCGTKTYDTEPIPPRRTLDLQLLRP